MRGRWGVVALLGAPAMVAGQAPADTVRSQVASFRVEEVARGVEGPAGLAFLPDGRGLVVERRPGRLSVLPTSGGALLPVGGLPAIFGHEDAGLHEAVPHPDFATNGLLYLTYSVGDSASSTLVLDRARLVGTRLVDRERLFEARPWRTQAYHYGGRIAFRDGYLFLTVGDRDNRDDAQDLSAHNGKVLRLHEDGRVPSDNPFVGRTGAAPEIWSYGHRNPQGLAFHPGTGALWLHEHGPRGGDEVNIVRRGANYGWPLVSWGREYSGEPIGDGRTHALGVEQPVHLYRPSIAPSGMVFYEGAAFPEWNGSLLVGALALQHLNRLTVEGDHVIHEERLLEGRGWRFRSLALGPGGILYAGTDYGLVIRLVPWTRE